MKREPTGKFITTTTYDETVKAFVPYPIPDFKTLEIDDRLRQKLDNAMLSLGRLDTVATLLPDVSYFIYTYIRKEAVMSSRIEGTQSSISDLLIYESEAMPGVPIDDVEEVVQYVAAINYGLKRTEEGFPVSLRLIREIHEVLLSQGRGSKKSPGEFRRSQNWIGGTRPGNAGFVPAPPDKLMECLSAFENYLHDGEVRTPTLIKIALAHVQFETIHPFLDGNGRVGRLLITLLLCTEKILSQPMLYLSLYFKKNKEQYYNLLDKVRIEGDWETWLDFFCDGVIETSGNAIDTAKRLMALVEKDRQAVKQIGKGSVTALRIHQEMEQHLIMSIRKMAAKTGLTTPTIVTAFNHLEKLGIVKEISGKQRGRIYAYSEYIGILNKGVE